MLRIFTLALLTSLSTALASAQTTSSTTATVTGTVTDQQSGVLPGVTVSLSGPSMMGVQTQVTDSIGLYRFVSIPPGEYKLVFELAGFATVNREGVRLTPGFTATINTQMGVATLTENVQVTGDSPVVDTQSTAINTTFDKETLANLPSARDYWAVLSEAPGVKLARIDVGGSAAGTQTGYFVYGTTGPEPADGRGHQLDGRHGVVRQLRRLRVVLGDFDRQRRLERRKPGAGRLHRAHQQVGRQPLHRLVLRRLRVAGPGSRSTSTPTR